MSKSEKTYFSFGDNFEEKFINEMFGKPDITMIELVSNSWDAVATEVIIDWPILDKNELNQGESFYIKDNGVGMTEEEFNSKWTQLAFDKRKDIGNKVEVMENIDRPVIGKNGKGRLGLFGFADSYVVITCKKGEISKFLVRKSNDFGKYAETIKKELTKNEEKIFDPKKESGTYIKCNINNNYIEQEDLISAISTRFGADPYFKVFINNREIKLLDLSVYDKHEYAYNDKIIQIIQIPRETFNRRLKQYQIVWWVNQRAVENDEWRKLGIPLEANNPLHNQYVFCIIVDFLEPHVKTDWTGFEDKGEVKSVKNFVKEKILELTKSFFEKSGYEKKVEAIKGSKTELEIINPIGRREVSLFLDQILERCPNIDISVLIDVVNVLANMEVSNRKYDLLKILSNLSPDDYDKLSEICETWSMRDAYLVLNELYNRLEVIAILEKVGDNPNAKELHMIQPLFENGLWIFGPQYEGVGNFAPNVSLKTGMKEILNTDSNFKESRKRPDLLTTSDQDIWDIYGSNKYEEDNIVGYRKILLLELKKGDSKISFDEMTQATKYVKLLKAHGKIQDFTKIDCYVIGSKVDSRNKEIEKVGNYAKIYPTTFDTIIRNAKKRTLDLKDKLEDVKGITDLEDDAMKEALKNKFGVPQAVLEEFS